MGVGGLVWVVGFNFQVIIEVGGFSSASFLFSSKYFLRGVMLEGGKISCGFGIFLDLLGGGAVIFSFLFLEVNFSPKSVVFINVSFPSTFVNSIQHFFFSKFGFIGFLEFWGGGGRFSFSKNLGFFLVSRHIGSGFLFCWGVLGNVGVMGGLWGVTVGLKFLKFRPSLGGGLGGVFWLDFLGLGDGMFRVGSVWAGWGGMGVGR